MLIDLIEGRNGPLEERRLSVELIVRASVRQLEGAAPTPHASQHRKDTSAYEPAARRGILDDP